MPNRQHGRISAIVLIALVTITSASFDADQPVERVIALADRSITLTVVAPGDARLRDRLVQTGDSAIRLLTEWLGTPEFSHITVDASRRRPAASVDAGAIFVGRRWLTPDRDYATDRQVVAGLASLFWPVSSRHTPWLSNGLAVYTAGRAIDELFPRQVATERFLGGMVPFAIRQAPLSPPDRGRPRIRRFQETAIDDEHASRAADGLYAVERLIGWPAVQQAIRELRRREVIDPDAMDDVFSVQSGYPMHAFVDRLVNGAPIDYAVTSMTSTPRGSDADRFDLRIGVSRTGPSPLADTDGEVAIAVTLADGTRFDDYWDDREPAAVLSFVGASPVTRAALDPDALLIADADRSNNVLVVDQRWSARVKLIAAYWAIWLQQAMLTYAGLA